MVWGSVITGAAGVAGGLLGGKSKKDAWKKQQKNVKKYVGEAQAQYEQFSPEMLEMYRGIMPELSALWQQARGQTSQIFLDRYQQEADASKQRGSQGWEDLTRRGLASSTNIGSYNDAQRQIDLRNKLAIDSAKAGLFQQLSIAETASKMQGRLASAGGIGNVAQSLAQFPMSIASFYGASGMGPTQTIDPESIGMFGGALTDLFKYLTTKKSGAGAQPYGPPVAP